MKYNLSISGEECNAAQCAEHGARAGTGVTINGECACACPQRAPLFREDRELCVDDLPGNNPLLFQTFGFYTKQQFTYNYHTQLPVKVE